MIVVLWSVNIYTHVLSSLCTYHGRAIDELVQSVCWFRNTATDPVKQELQFVGQESGKCLAIRNLVYMNGEAMQWYRYTSPYPGI